MAEKISKEQAGFQDPSLGEDHCKNCAFFQMDKPKHCHLVEGLIGPDDYCKLFEPKFTLRG